MRCIILILLFLVSCGSSTSLTPIKNAFYTADIEDGKEIIKSYNWKLIKIDTLKEKKTIIYRFHYKVIEQ